MKKINEELQKHYDSIVFKAIKRCLKEENTLCYHDFGNIVKRCYISRNSHPNEGFEQNIYYWPEDCGRLFKDNFTKLIYLSYIVNRICPESRYLKARITEIISSMSFEGTTMGNGLPLKSEPEAYYNEIFEALKKGNEPEEQIKTKAEIVMLLVEASKNDLPL